MEVDYYSKYLKYKNKYLKLKGQLGAAVTKKTKKEKNECYKHGHAYCTTLAIGCHWNGRNCVNNTCFKNAFGKKRGPLDCTATAGCTWHNSKCTLK